MESSGPCSDLLRHQHLPGRYGNLRDAIPTGKVSLDEGDAWLKANTQALMLVPSVIVLGEFNVLVNPAHPDAKKLRAGKLRKWTYDQRLVSPGSTRST